MITYYSSNRIIDYNFGATSYSGTLPATYYVGLSTSTINIDGSGATEPAGGAYARIAFTNNKSNWSTSSNGVLSNAAAVTFVESSASWGTITYVFLADAVTAGNIWFYDVLSPSRAVATLTTVIFSIGAITVTLNNT